ncbi:MAG: N-6 DNA methylase, partial [Propionibacteriaceae bacterium]|nr:N-6 DNA methylase [Propionibacteriaceae bacterium]
PENHRFAIPKGSHWRDIRQTTENVGARILGAMRAIESANPGTLPGVFGDGDWGNKDLLPDATLLDLIEHFSTQTLSIANLPEDELGSGYEYLIKKFADDSGHTAQEFYTNRTLVHLMTLMLQPQPGESVYDPTCGTGGMLISTVAELKRQGLEWRSLRLYGQELNYGTSSIARMNLFLHGITDGHIAHGDTLARPAFLDEGGRLQRFDVVLANPPYSIKAWNRDAFAADPYGRNMWGVPPQGRADYAFFQHIAASLDPKMGRAAILFPHGVLFRREEAALREALVKSDLVECVLGLGAGLFYNSPMEAVVVTLRANKPAERRGKVLFINAVGEFAREQAQSFLRDTHQQKILAAYQGYADVDGFAKVATLADIADKSFSLAIPLYVAGAKADEAEAPDVDDAVAQWRAAAEASDQAISDVLALLRDGRRAPAGPGRPDDSSSTHSLGASLDIDKTRWRRVAFGDVIDSITDRVDDPSQAGVDRYVGLEHLDPGVMTVQRWDTPDKVEAQKLRFQAGDVIFGRRRAYQKKVARADFEGICSAHALVLRAKPGLIDPDFLPVFLSSDYFLDRAIGISVGSLSPTVNWRDLKVQQFDLPALDEQKRIADLLWAVERHRCIVSSVRYRVQTVRDLAVEGALSGRVSTTTLDRVASITSGVTLGPARKEMPLWMSYLRVANVQRGRLDLIEVKEVGATETEAQTKSVRFGDVLVVEGHASVDEIGRAAIWTSDNSPLHQNHLFRVRAGNGVRPRFLMEWINGVTGRDYMKTVAKSTSGLYTINSTVLKAMPVPAMSLQDQDILLSVLSAIEALSRNLEYEIDALVFFRNSLLATIFGGA